MNLNGFELRTQALGLLLGVALLSPLAVAEDRFSGLDSAGEDVAQAAAAAAELQAREDVELTEVLTSMQGKSAVAKNWYLAVAQSIADRDPQQSTQQLQQFLPKLSEDPTARYWAFTYLTRGNDALRQQTLESMLADPCLELRYEAVALRLNRLKDQPDLGATERTSAYQELLAAARLPEQIQEVATQLKELGREINLLEHFGFVDTWMAIGPFDNSGQTGFDVAYPPEQDYMAGKLTGELNQKYAGKETTVQWRQITTQDSQGSLDLAAAFDKAKGAVVYALGEFVSREEQSCEVRIGCPNAVKVWVNGEELIHREVYHTGSQIDQYVAPVKLKPGTNSILVKACQNEQTDAWAQDYAFQLRFTDSSGLAIPNAQ